MRANTAVRSTAGPDAGTYHLRMTGPAVQEFSVAVGAQATTLTFRVKFDATYAGTKPSMSVLLGAAFGVTDATATAVGSAGSYETLSLNFTPTAIGIVKLRLLSSDTNGAGVVDWDEPTCTRADMRDLGFLYAGEPLRVLFDASASAGGGGGSSTSMSPTVGRTRFGRC